MKQYSKYSDNELFESLKGPKQGSESAFAELYSRYSNRIYAYCLRITGNEEDARDIFQETFLKFYDTAKKKSNIDNVPGYLLIISRNICLNYKRNKKINIDLEDVVLSNRANQNYEQKELLDLISTSLELLDFEYREAFVLRQYQGLSYKEISNITGDSVSAIKNRVWRAKEKLKTILTPYLEDLSQI